MISTHQWKQDCFDGITAAFRSGQFGSGQESNALSQAGNLRLSAKAPIDEVKMRHDTVFRTNGRCGAPKPEKIARLGLALSRLREKLFRGK